MNIIERLEKKQSELLAAEERYRSDRDNDTWVQVNLARETLLSHAEHFLPALLAVAKAAEKQSDASCALTEYSHRRNKTDEEWGRLASKVTVADRELFDALAKLKGVE